MLSALTKAWRKRAAWFAVALYAFCALAPTAILTVADTAQAAHCLTGDRDMSPGAAASHIQADGAAHDHSAPAGDDRSTHPAKCCGMFCLSAIAPGFAVAAVSAPPHVEIAALPVHSLPGLGSDRIDRPPRSLASL